MSVGKGVDGRWFVVDACCLLSMQSFRKVPKVTKIKDGRVARADLKASMRETESVWERGKQKERGTELVVKYSTCQRGIGSPLIYAT